MADIHAAILYVLKLEDSTLSGLVHTDPADSGGATRYGIARRWHPELVSGGFFTNMPKAEALAQAVEVYTNSYCTPLRLAEVRDQRIANSLLGEAVNTGLKSAVKLLQAAVADTQHGSMDDETLRLVNASDPATLLGTYIALQIAYYRRIVALKPSQARFINGWIARAQKAALVVDEA